MEHDCLTCVKERQTNTHTHRERERERELESWRYVLVQVIDLLVRLLRTAPVSGECNEPLMTVFSAVFDVMHSYLLGHSRKNKAFFLQHLHFLHHQFNAKVSSSTQHSLVLENI